MENPNPTAEPYTIPSITPEKTYPPRLKETNHATANAIRSARPLVHSSTAGATMTAVMRSAASTLTTELNVKTKMVLKTPETATATENPQIKTGTTYLNSSRS